MRLHSDAHRLIPQRRQSTESVTYVGEGGGGRERALPSGLALAGFLDPNTVTRAIEDLGRSGYRPLAAWRRGHGACAHRHMTARGSRRRPTADPVKEDES